MRWGMVCAGGWGRAMTEGALLSVDGLRVAYGDAVVVDDVSFTLLPGACLGIIGESGAGKSQVFLALTGLTSPRARVSGRADLAGRDLLGEQGAQARGRDVAMIFQDPMTSLTPHLRIG